jgi:hypothetical protein
MRLCLLCEQPLDAETQDVMFFSACEHPQHGAPLHFHCLLRGLLGHHLRSMKVCRMPNVKVRNDPVWS